SKSIQIHIDDKDWKKAPERAIPPEARVFGDADSLKSLFQLAENSDGWLWNDFYEQMRILSDNASAWAASLADMMRNLIAKRSLPTGLPLYRFRQGNDSAIYRPAVDWFRKRKGTFVFNISFVDLPRETTTEPAGPATALSHALALGRMFRWGVLMPTRD